MYFTTAIINAEDNVNLVEKLTVIQEEVSVASSTFHVETYLPKNWNNMRYHFLKEHKRRVLQHWWH